MPLATSLASILTAAMVQHGAHVHGEAELAIAFTEIGGIEVQLTAPAYNFLVGQGGEDAHDHGDHDHDDHGHEHDAHGHDDHNHDEHAHDDHGHEHGHDHDHTDPWEIVEGQIADGNVLFDFGAAECNLSLNGFERVNTEGGHMDVYIGYTGYCSAPDRMSTIETTLFDTFAGMETVNGVFIGPDQQSAFTLTRENERTRLTQ